MAKSKKAAPKKRAYKYKNFGGSLVDDTFEIEVSPPPTNGRGSLAESIIVLGKLDRTLKLTKQGQAVIVPRKNTSSIKRHLKDNYPNDRFIFSKVNGSDSTWRMYRLPLAKK